MKIFIVMPGFNVAHTIEKTFLGLSEKLKTLTEKVKEFKLQQSKTKKSDSKTSDSMDKYKDNDNYNI